MKITLIYPPLDDPTMPYHSTAYLMGNLAANGFTDVAVRDLSIEFVNYCLEHRVINEFYTEGERRIIRLRQRQALDFQQQQEFLALSLSKRIPADALVAAASHLRRHCTFQDYSLYTQSVSNLNTYFSFLGALSYPSAIRGMLQVCMGNYSLYNLDDLFNRGLMDRVCWPFRRYFDDRLAGDAQLKNADCLGISIIYDHQLTFALWLARTFKERYPDKLVLLGGTAISNLYKYLIDKQQMKRFFSLCDAIVVGEGETSICEIADRGGDLYTNPPIPNTITYRSASDVLHLPERILYENVAAVGRPLYDYPWDLYLSPARGINYSPTRGCYWNRCTFCDYGLNVDTPTSRWREKPIPAVIDDLKEIKTRNNVDYVYFSVDAMMPAYVERLADAMVETGIDIRWAAELRLEKVFTKQRCDKMKQSGCVCASFGVESGSQRVLDLMQKGTKLSAMAETMKNCAGAGIAVQIMAFNGFPSETKAEGEATFAFLRDNYSNWSCGGVGQFVLTGGAAIAKNPKKFGITIMKTEGADVARSVAYREGNEGERKLLLTEDADEPKCEAHGMFPRTPGRPWAGGTDSLHSLILYSLHGKDFFKANSLPESEHIPIESIPDPMNSRVWTQGPLVESSFDLNEIRANKTRFNRHKLELMRAAKEPTYAELLRFASNVEAVSDSELVKMQYWIGDENNSVSLHETIYELISSSADTSQALRQTLAEFHPVLRERVAQHLRKLHALGFIRLEAA